MSIRIDTLRVPDSSRGNQCINKSNANVPHQVQSHFPIYSMRIQARSVPVELETLGASGFKREMIITYTHHTSQSSENAASVDNSREHSRGIARVAAAVRTVSDNSRGIIDGYKNTSLHSEFLVPLKISRNDEMDKRKCIN